MVIPLHFELGHGMNDCLIIGRMIGKTEGGGGGRKREAENKY